MCYICVMTMSCDENENPEDDDERLEDIPVQIV